MNCVIIWVLIWILDKLVDQIRWNAVLALVWSASSNYNFISWAITFLNRGPASLDYPKQNWDFFLDLNFNFYFSGGVCSSNNSSYNNININSSSSYAESNPRNVSNVSNFQPKNERNVKKQKRRKKTTCSFSSPVFFLSLFLSKLSEQKMRNRVPGKNWDQDWLQKLGLSHQKRLKREKKKLRKMIGGGLVKPVPWIKS